MIHSSDLECDEILAEQTDGVLLVTINRPKKLNAMTVAMDRAMNTLMYLINNDESVRAVILTGSGGRAFSAGSDLADLDSYGSNWMYRNRFDARLDYAHAIWLVRKPIIAAVDGYCIGGGLEMACASDIRLATRRSSFGAGEINWGWHGGSGQTQYLTRQIGSGHSSLMLLTGSRINAEEAQRIGLVQEVTDEDRLLTRANELASQISEKAPIAVERTKHMIRMAQNVGLDSALAIENDSFSYLMMTEDAAEGQRAFAEGRRPKFTGQ